MIDTWARHLAALSEARRLTRMVVANHPDFAAVTGTRAMSEAAKRLDGDPVFQAHRHLTAALALLDQEVRRELRPATEGAALAGVAEQIRDIVRLSPPEPAAGPAQTALAAAPGGAQTAAL